MHAVSFQDFTCPNCYSGFIEELEAPPDLTDDSDTEMEDVAPVEVEWKHVSKNLNKSIYLCFCKESCSIAN